MDPQRYGIRAGEHIPGEVVGRYLLDYAKKHGLVSRWRGDTSVYGVKKRDEHEGGGWVIKTRSSKQVDGAETGSVTARKLIFATGLTSTPNLPTFVGQDDFGAPIVHSRDFVQRADLLESVDRVVVLGGAKSAWDIAYAFADAGKGVDLVIRSSGRGPVWMAPSLVTPLKRLLEGLVTTRFLTWFSPCVFGAEDGYGGVRAWLHGTRLGRWIVDSFWGILESDVVDLNGYEKHAELKSLRPWCSAFEIGNGLSIWNYPSSPLDMVRDGRIRTHVADIERLSSNTVHLANGEALQTDALLCATGWKPRPDIQWEGVTPSDLGLPYTSAIAEPMAAKADAKILEQFPRLKRHTENLKLDVEQYNHPYRLYRFLVPPALAKDRNIAFAGHMQCLATTSVAATQALWITAFFDGKLDRLPQDEGEMKWQTMLATQWARLRYPAGHSSSYPDFVFDAIPYLDMLLRDLGVGNHRKAGMLRELTEAYSPQSYEGVLEEWKEKHA